MEIWKDIPKYKGFYQISNLGRVKSLKREVPDKGGLKTIRERILKQSPDNCGYLMFALSKKGVNKRVRTHQMVAVCFLNHFPCGLKKVVDHINNIKTDNRVENLQIITHRKNVSKDRMGGSSKYTGVYYDKKINKWSASIHVKNRQFRLGSYLIEKEAGNAYIKALTELNKTGNITISDFRKKSSSKYKWICWHKRFNKYEASIYHNNKKIFVGYFKDEEDAYIAQQKKIKKYLFY